MAAAAGKDQHSMFVMQRRGNGRGIAGTPLIAGLPDEFSCDDVEGNDTGTAIGADVDNQLVTFNKRRGTHAEEVLAQFVFVQNIVLPAELSARKIDAMKLPFRPDGEDRIIADDRAGAGAVAVAVLILIRGGIGEAPV